MALRNGHGTGAGVPRVEVLPADELPDGIPVEARPAATATRGPDGRFLPGRGTADLARRGAEARADQLRLERLLGRVELPDDHPLVPYRRHAAEFRRAHCAELAETVGGGVCGAAPSSVVATAALQLAASRWLFDQAALQQSPTLAMAASRLADSSRQNLLAAHELAAREARARRADHPPLDLSAALQAGGDSP